MTALSLLILQLVASSAMAAIAWFVQQVHYPLFARLGGGVIPGGRADAARPDELAAWHDENVRRTRPVVLVPMAIEAGTAAWLAAFPLPGIGRLPALAGLALVATAILSTLLVQVPLHERLRAGEDDPAIVRSLVRSTGLRTAVWTARAGLAAWMLAAFTGVR